MPALRPLTTAVLAVGLAVFGLRQFMTAPGQDRLRRGEAVDITALRSPLPQPGFLACPPGYCDTREAAASPIFAVPWLRLQDCWRRLIAAEPRAIEVARDSPHRRLVYIVHTPMLGFPDIVTVEFAALGPESSGIALFSRSRYGRSDFGTNRRRVEGWLARLQTREPVMR